jgi:hypothetical protein
VIAERITVQAARNPMKLFESSSRNLSGTLSASWSSVQS